MSTTPLFPIRTIRGLPMRVTVQGGSLIRATNGRDQFVYDQIWNTVTRIEKQVAIVGSTDPVYDASVILRECGVHIGTSRARTGESMIWMTHRDVGRALRVLRARGYRITVQGAWSYTITRVA